MSTHELYTRPVDRSTWDVPVTGDARFTWEYDDGRDKLLALYQKGKDKQWDSVKRIDWDLEVDPYNVLGTPDSIIAIHGTPLWERMDEEQRPQ
ncbi:aminobenzoate oxygenase, partial [Micromonospora harpali]